MKTLLRTLFFLLLTAQICFTQWGEDNFSDSQSSYPESNLKFKNSQNEFVVSKDNLNNTFIKSNSDSVSEAWINRYASGLAPMGCSGNKIVIDNDGNVYVAGSIDHPEEGSNFYTIKYNSAGELLWAVQYNGSQNSSDAAKAIAWML